VAGGNNCAAGGFLIVFGPGEGKAKRWPVGGEKRLEESETNGVGWWHRARGFPGGARDLLPLRHWALPLVRAGWWCAHQLSLVYCAFFKYRR
jgi:hypothetical protein